jgi:hypothetical protein
MAKARKSTPPTLALTRADNGDWALHPPAAAIEAGEAVPTLKSGPAQKVDGKWNRPDQSDYNFAWLMFAHYLASKQTGS